MWIHRFPPFRMPRYSIRTSPHHPILSLLALLCGSLAWIYLAALYFAAWMIEIAVWVDVRVACGVCNTVRKFYLRVREG